MSGWNILARWEPRLRRGQRGEPAVLLRPPRSGHEYINEEDRERVDIEWQHYFEPAPWVGVTWGAGYRWDKDNFEG